MRRVAIVLIVSLMVVTPSAAGSGPQFSDSLRHWKTNAESGESRAQYFLGLAYSTGRGVNRNYEAAYMWFAIASSSGEPHAAESQARIANLLTMDRRVRAKRKARRSLLERQVRTR